MKTLKLADGREIDLKTRQLVTHVEPEVVDEPSPAFEPSASEIKLEDLPTTPSQMNVINAVLGYTLIGLPTRDIELALGCSSSQLEAIMSSEAYDRTRKMILEAFVRGQTNTAREILSTGAIDAAQQVVSIAKKSKNEANRLRASENILKVTGVANDDANSMMAQGLVIKIVRDNAPVDINIKVG